MGSMMTALCNAHMCFTRLQDPTSRRLRSYAQPVTFVNSISGRDGTGMDVINVDELSEEGEGEDDQEWEDNCEGHEGK